MEIKLTFINLLVWSTLLWRHLAAASLFLSLLILLLSSSSADNYNDKKIYILLHIVFIFICRKLSQIIFIFRWMHITYEWTGNVAALGH